ncbi:MAG TPA: hypothetical protein VJP45_07390 [Candidatus Limnocylindria bacterium]|nr:hypothetical protein [Candidatus Limnocylindria bacterium]
MSSYDPARDPVRVAGRLLRWSLAWLAVPALLGALVSGNIDVRAMPLFGTERLSAVLLLDGQAYFGHLDDSGESGTLLLRDVYYFRNAEGGPTGLPVGLVRRGTEAHEPADGMRISRERVLAVERVGLDSAVAAAIQVARQIAGTTRGVSLNPVTVATPRDLIAQRRAAEHALQRSFLRANDQLVKLNELVLPVTKAEAETITQKAIADLRVVRRNAITTLGTASGMSAADAEAYARATDPTLDGQTFLNEPAVLLAPSLDAVVVRAAQLYAQVGDAAAKQLTQPRTASPTPSPTPTPTPTATPRQP